MFNEDKSIVITFNGEIYNYQELKKELEEKGHKFKTDSDTETIIRQHDIKRSSGFLCLPILR